MRKYLMLFFLRSLFVSSLSSFFVINLFYLLIRYTMNLRTSMGLNIFDLLDDLMYRAPLNLLCAFTLAMASVLWKAKKNRQISTLICLGISPKKVFSPFLTYTFFFSWVMFCVIEWGIPGAKYLQKNFAKTFQSTKKNPHCSFTAMVMDGGTFVRHKNNDTTLFIYEEGDVLWNPSFSSIEIKETTSSMQIKDAKKLPLSSLFLAILQKRSEKVKNYNEALSMKLSYVFFPYLLFLVTYILLFLRKKSGGKYTFWFYQSTLFFSFYTFAKVFSTFTNAYIISLGGYFFGFFFILLCLTITSYVSKVQSYE